MAVAGEAGGASGLWVPTEPAPEAGAAGGARDELRLRPGPPPRPPAVLRAFPTGGFPSPVAPPPEEGPRPQSRTQRSIMPVRTGQQPPRPGSHACRCAALRAGPPARGRGASFLPPTLLGTLILTVGAPVPAMYRTASRGAARGQKLSVQTLWLLRNVRPGAEGRAPGLREERVSWAP